MAPATIARGMQGVLASAHGDMRNAHEDLPRVSLPPQQLLLCREGLTHPSLQQPRLQQAASTNGSKLTCTCLAIRLTQLWHYVTRLNWRPGMMAVNLQSLQVASWLHKHGRATCPISCRTSHPRHRCHRGMHQQYRPVRDGRDNPSRRRGS